MAGPLLGGLLTGLGSLGASLITNSGAKKRQSQADLQNINFWNMQNKYNHPSQQMARLKEAGLNPNLVYDQSVSGATGSAGNVAPSKAAPYNMENFLGQGVQGFQNTSQALKNIQDYKTTKALRPGQIELQRAQINDMQNKADLSFIQKNIASATQQTEIKKIQEQLRLAVANGNKAQQQALAETYDNGIRSKGFEPNTVGYLLANAFQIDTSTPQGRADMLIKLAGFGLAKMGARIFGAAKTVTSIKKKIPGGTKTQTFNQQSQFNKIWAKTKSNK
jgi:hypothetical protein